MSNDIDQGHRPSLLPGLYFIRFRPHLNISFFFGYFIITVLSIDLLVIYQ